MSYVKHGNWRLAPPWTGPRAHGLKVLAVHQIARVSSIFETGMMPPTVFRSTALWLEELGLARLTHSGLGATVELTDAGRKLVLFLDRKKATA